LQGTAVSKPPFASKVDMSLVTHNEITETGSILSGAAESRERPDWFRDQQGVAWEKFESIPSPTRKDQAWRFSNVALLDLAPFRFSPELSDDDRANVRKYSRGLDKFAGRMIFAGDQLIERDVVSENLKKRGVIFQPLERAMVEHADLFRKHFMSTEASLGSARFAAFHREHFFSSPAAWKSNCRSKFSTGCAATMCRYFHICFS
jgi:Fe-S cluster assembly protein SufD